MWGLFLLMVKIFPIIARTIYENCPPIGNLSLGFLSSNFVEFERLLQTCQNSKGWSMFMTCMKKFEPEEHEEKSLTKLEYGEKLSKSLRTIKFSRWNFKFSLKILETLLDNWKGRTAPSIITSNLDYEGILIWNS